MGFKRERSRGRPGIYLTPSLWKGMRLDTSLASTPERSASGISALALRDVFSSWDANARVTVLGRGSSLTCWRSRDLATGKIKQGYVSQNAHKSERPGKRERASAHRTQQETFCYMLFSQEGSLQNMLLSTGPDNSQCLLSLVLNTYR